MGVDLERGLLALGLEKRDAKIFDSVLLLKSATAYQIAKHTGIAPRSVYDSISSLQNRGLVVSFTENNKTKYRAANLSHISKLIEEKSEILKGIVPTIAGLKREETFDSVIYTGVGGLRALLDDMLDTTKKGEEIVGLGDNGRMTVKFMPAIMERFHAERLESGIRFRSLFSDVPEARERFPRANLLPLASVRVLPMKINDYSGMWMYGDRLLISDMSARPTVVMIRNENVRQSFGAFFDFFWRNSRKSFAGR